MEGRADRLEQSLTRGSAIFSYEMSEYDFKSIPGLVFPKPDLPTINSSTIVQTLNPDRSKSHTSLPPELKHTLSLVLARGDPRSLPAMGKAIEHLGWLYSRWHLNYQKAEKTEDMITALKQTIFDVIFQELSSRLRLYKECLLLLKAPHALLVACDCTRNRITSLRPSQGTGQQGNLTCTCQMNHGSEATSQGRPQKLAWTAHEMNNTVEDFLKYYQQHDLILCE